MKVFLLTVIFSVLIPSLQAMPLKMDLNNVGWTYTHLTQQFGEMHVIQNAKDKKQKAFIKRQIAVLKPKEEYGSENFFKEKCPKLSEKMTVVIDTKKTFCKEEVTMNGEKTVAYLFPTKRKSDKVKNSFYWNIVSFAKATEINEQVILSLRNELEKNNY